MKIWDLKFANFHKETYDKICPYFHEFAADSYEPRILLRSAWQIDRGCFSFS